MPEGRPVITVLLVAAIAGAAALVVTASWEFSRDRIAANERALLLSSLSNVLDPSLLERDLDPVLISVEDPALDDEEPIDVFLPMAGDTPIAAVFASIAPDGYNAPIRLLIGIDIESGTITGVRVVDHRETPGLGDLIEIGKSDWILQFDGKSAAEPPASAWALRKDADAGEFDAITGATVTPRAVVRAVHNTLLYFEANRAELLGDARRVAESRNNPDSEN